ncbi:MAG: alpha/beta hydrolase [Phycisphaerales bacterium]|nr:alpha/beta hydrolase [Phycisphaerales bacterium]
MGLLWLLLYGGLSALGLGSLLIAVELLRPRRRTFASALAKNLPTDPGQLGWTFEETQFVFSDGSNTPGWVIQGKKADGPVVVVCHGWGEGRYDVLPRLHPVVALASRIVVYDQRGHGESEAKLSRLGTWEVRDLRCVVDQVGERLGTHQPIVLLGYSMGAGVVIQFVAGLPDATEHQGNQPIINAVVVEGSCPKLSIALAGILRTLHFPPYPMAWIAPWLVIQPWGLGSGMDGSSHDHPQAALPVISTAWHA